MPKPKKVSLRGRWCRRCNGTGRKPGGHPSSTSVDTMCPDCKWVGFVGLTSDEVRQAELEAMKEPA